MRKAPLLPLILCAALSGCDPLIEPQPVPVSLTTARLTGPMLPVVIMAGRDTIRINGSIGVNEPCYDFSASAATQRDTLMVTLFATRRSGFCSQVLAAFSYDLSIGPVSPGASVLRLVYDRRGPPTYRETVLQQDL